MVELLIAAVGIVGLLVIWRVVITAITYLIAWSLKILPLVGRRGSIAGARSAREPVAHHSPGCRNQV